MNSRSVSLTFVLLGASALTAIAQAPAAPKPPIVNDPALRIELIATVPEIEAPTTVCGAPDGSIYVGNDPRDGRLSNKEPVNTITRFGPYESPDLIRNPDGKLAPPVFHRKRTVFADKIYSPAGSAWHDGYLYVLHDPLLTRFKDTDGDGIADVREDLVTNLGIPPNEGLNDHVVSGFTLGMDGFFYISVGDRGIFQAKSVKDGSSITMQGGGIARCRTDGTQLEVFSTGTRNHLQVNLDAEDNAFTRDNTDDGNGWWTRLTHHIEGGYYGYPYDYRGALNYGVTQPSEQTLNAIKQHGGVISTVDGPSKGNLTFTKPAKDLQPVTGERFLPAMADFGGGSPTGGLCYLSDGLPEQYRGKHFFSEWGKAGIFVTEVARDGATFRLVSDTKLIEPEKGGDFRPMQLSVAADGSLLIADWGYGGWKSPKVAGAVWRLYWPEAKPAPRLADESKATVEELLAALGHPDRDQRLRSQWAVAAKVHDAVKKFDYAANTRIAPDGGKWPDSAPERKALAKAMWSESGSLETRMHALWAIRQVFQQLIEERPKKPGLFTETVFFGGTITDQLQAKSTIIGRQAIRALGLMPIRQDMVVTNDSGSIAKELRSFDPAVRMQAAIALGRIAELASSQARHDRNIDTGQIASALFLRLIDEDAWVRFAARRGMAKTKEWFVISASAEKNDPRFSEQAWMATASVCDESIVQVFANIVAGKNYFPKSVGNRKQAVAALGQIAYQPKPYDGHWWGTQPVKNPRPLNSVPWAGTPQALAALTAALSDPDAGVRLAAAKAFTLFVMPLAAPSAASPAKAAAFSTPVDASLAPRRRLSRAPSAASSPTVGGSSDHRQRLSEGASSAFTPTVIGFLPDRHRLSPPPSVIDGALKAADGALKAADGARKAANGASKAANGALKAVDAPEKAADGGQKVTTLLLGADAVSQKVTLVAAAAAAGEPKAAADAGKDTAALDQAVAAARTALRARLTAETDSTVRRQLIEALGVQKDPQAMEVFRQIALGDPDMAFRETAIAAVVSIGGADAKKVIAQLADAQLSPAATRRIITAAGELKVLEAAPALIAHLKDADAGNRELAARSLQQLGPKSGAGPALIEALADKEGKVQAAAVDALGSYREKAALPGIIALLEKKKHLRETTGALVLMPDESAIPVLVETLRDKNTTFRRNAIRALKAMREKALPQVEALLASGRVPEELVPEIKNAFDSGAIVKWKMVGVFENVWEAVHPPEKDALAEIQKAALGNTIGSGFEVNTPWLLARKYHNAEGKDVGWIDVTADSEVGRVDLAQVFKTTAMVCAYAFTEIDAAEAGDAKLFTSVDDEIAVWLNGQQVQNLSGSRGYEPDKYETTLPLKAGKNSLFVKIGNKSGSWVFHARIPGFENGKFIKSKEASPEEKQKLFALATKPDGTFINPGNAKNGEKLFFDQAAALGGMCVTCHAVGAKGGQIGPALTTVGANYKRADLITSLHEPSKTIALGFEQVMLETTGGETITGSLRAESADAFTIVDAAGQSKSVKKTEVKKKTDLHVSLMPPGLTLGLKPEDFTDLLAYLESLKGQ